MLLRTTGITSRSRCACRLSLALLAWTSTNSSSRSFSLVQGFSREPLFQQKSSHTLPAISVLTTTTRMASTSASSSSESTPTLSIARNLDEVRTTVHKACEAQGLPLDAVRLVAVSKTKPLELLQEAYQHDQRAFGENYVQELMTKAEQFAKLQIHDVEWHFIGPLQSNKAAKLVKTVLPLCRKLTIETVASLKLANKLQKATSELELSEPKVLNIFIQVNTSGEASKSGVSTMEEVKELIVGIQETCPLLHVQGLMTIGAPGDTTCFDMLREMRDVLGTELGLPEPLELSMGMSNDYIQAIAAGATNVRVGSTIFGARDYSQKK